ncbi:DUF6745 domain-containing protein [Tistlia consotensis]|uniref:DUF6745 domain-containing protein n=1 Tax=Tistlia consotensis TaxID=1321365 RepID=UPI00117C7D98|nr:hypothetical protein [Tistlia consotensis]
MPGHSASAWRDRLGWRVPFDRQAAESAIRGAYAAAGLSAPAQVLWARGPGEAARIIDFLVHPPGALWRITLELVVAGVLVWIALALAVDAGGFAGASPLTSAVVSVSVAGVALALAASPALPSMPGGAERHAGRPPVALGGLVFAVLAIHAFALQRLGGLPADPVGRAGALVLSASLGALPGLLFHQRIRRVYAGLPPSLRSLHHAVSAGDRLEAVREAAWAPFRRATPGPRPHEALLHLFQTAQLPAWQEMPPLEFQRQAAPLRQWRMEVLSGTPWDRTIQPVRSRIWPLLAWLSVHLDGMADTPRAAGAEQAGALGAAAAFAELAFRVDRLYPFETIAVAVCPPTMARLDAEGRPHGEDGPAFAWADGTRIFAWRGRPIPPELVDPKRPLTLWRIRNEWSTERRWVLIERYGIGRYLLDAGAKEVSRDACGRLYRLAQTFDEPILAVRVVNRTAEPDGSFQEYWLRVPPTTATARDGVAWTFGLRADEYDPAMEA